LPRSFILSYYQEYRYIPLYQQLFFPGCILQQLREAPTVLKQPAYLIMQSRQALHPPRYFHVNSLTKCRVIIPVARIRRNPLCFSA